MQFGTPVGAQPPPMEKRFIGFQVPPNQRVSQASSWTVIPSSSASRTFMVNDSDIAIAVMGATGSGKTSFINLASGSNLRIGRGLKSCTNIVQVAEPFLLDGKSVTLIDTPGFDDTTRSDAEILRMIAAFLAETYKGGKKLAGVIYLHRISDFRMSGISTRNFKMFRELCGESTLKNVVILTNMWGEVGLELGEARETELKTQDLFFKPALDKGAQILRHDNTHETAINILRHLTENLPMPLQIQEELVDQGKDIRDTAAGAEMNKELVEQLKKHRDEMRKLQQEMQEAIRTKDEETREELEKDRKILQEKMDKVRTDAETLASAYSEDMRKLQQRMQEESEVSRRDREKVAEEYNRQITLLTEQLNQAKSNDAETAGLLRQLEQLKSKSIIGGFFTNLGRAMDRVFGMA